MLPALGSRMPMQLESSAHSSLQASTQLNPGALRCSVPPAPGLQSSKGSPSKDDDAISTPVTLIIRNGLIVDGTGREPYVGSLAVAGKTICGIAEGSGSTPLFDSRTFDLSRAKVLDATGKLVCPGWVDIHTHMDGAVSWDAELSPLTSNGVTTCVAGNCGVGFAPIKAKDRKFLMGLMEGVEDIPLGAMQAGIQWEWESFPEFLDAVESRELACDFAAFVAHGPVRAYVLGERANLPDRPGGPETHPVTPDEIDRMAAVVREAVAAGALGFSTSRTLLHRDKWGALVPGTLAGETEICRLGQAVAEGGGGLLELATDFMCYDDKAFSDDDHERRLRHYMREWSWMQTLSRRAFDAPGSGKVRVCFCLGMPSGTRQEEAHGYRLALKQLDLAVLEGADMWAQCFTRAQGLLMCLRSQSHPFTQSPTFRRVARRCRGTAGLLASPGLTKLVAALSRPEIRDAILSETLAHVEEAAQAANAAGQGDGNFGIVLPKHWDGGASDEEGGEREDGEDEEEDLSPGNLNGAVSDAPGALAHMLVDSATFSFRWDPSYVQPRDESVAAEAARRRPISLSAHDVSANATATAATTTSSSATSSAERARRQRQQSILGVYYEWLLEDGGERVVTNAFMNYATMGDRDTREMLLHPRTVPGLGDAGAHLGFICDNASHTHLLTRYVRDEGVLSLAHAVKLHTHDTAALVGLHDRGELVLGKRADINVIDLAALTVHCPQLKRDLPKQAMRWVQHTSGYVATICAGVVTFEHGRPTGARPGRLVRNPQSAHMRRDAAAETAADAEAEAGNGGLSERAINSLHRWFLTLRFESQFAVFGLLCKIVGSKRLEAWGFQLAEMVPLPASKL